MIKSYNFFSSIIISIVLCCFDNICDAQELSELKHLNPNNKKNIIFILTDDHRYDFFGFTGKIPWLETPALDKLAEKGFYFENAFVTTSLCSPSRASIITGQYSLVHKVGKVAIKIVRQITTVPTGKINAVQRLVTLPGKKMFKSRMPNQKIEQGQDFQVRLSVLEIDDVVLAGFGDEEINEIGMYLKQESPCRNTFVVTHCNGNVGYLITDEALKEGGYEPMVSKSMPGCEKVLIDNLLEMIDLL